MLTTCRHIMPSGLSCQSPAMRGTAFCYYHGRRIPPAGKNPSTEHQVEMPATLHQNAIPHALRQVIQDLADGKISARRASILLYGLQMALDHPEPYAPVRTARTSAIAIPRPLGPEADVPKSTWPMRVRQPGNCSEELPEPSKRHAPELNISPQNFPQDPWDQAMAVMNTLAEKMGISLETPSPRGHQS